MAFTSEADLEAFLMEELSDLGITSMHGASTAPDHPLALRPSYHQTVLEPVLLDALRVINPDLPERVLVEASKKLLDVQFTTDPAQENRRIHRLMVDGIKTTYLQDGEERNTVVRLVDWQDQHNDWRAVNQFDVVGKTPRIPDVVVFLNGMPLVVIELKGTEGKTLRPPSNR